MTTVIEEARKMATANVLRHLAVIHGGEQGWMREGVASILRCEQDAHPEVLAFVAAIELGERRAEAANVTRRVQEFRLASGQPCPHGSIGPCSVCGDER